MDADCISSAAVSVFSTLSLLEATIELVLKSERLQQPPSFWVGLSLQSKYQNQ